MFEGNFECAHHLERVLLEVISSQQQLVSGGNGVKDFVYSFPARLSSACNDYKKVGTKWTNRPLVPGDCRR